MVTSGLGTSAEEVNLEAPLPGLYIVVVHGWQTDGPDANYTLFSWAFGPDTGNMTVYPPAAATLGATETVTVDWTGLSEGTKYLGAVSHSDSTDVLGLTLVNIETDNGLATASAQNAASKEGSFTALFPLVGR